MPNYRADPDINALFESRLAIPRDLGADEAARLRRFLAADQVLERFYSDHPGGERPPEADLRRAAEAAMEAYEQRSERLPVGWQKFLVLQAGVAGGRENLDSPEIQRWAYDRVQHDHPEWLGPFDDDIDREMPMRWLTQSVGIAALIGRRSPGEETSRAPKAASGGCAVALFVALAPLALPSLVRLASRDR